MPNILITGARGFIGQRLVPLLIDEGHVCRTTSRTLNQHPTSSDENNIDIVPFDLDDQTVDYGELLKDVDVVIHLAARVHIMEKCAQDQDIYQHTNIYRCRRDDTCIQIEHINTLGRVGRIYFK